MNFATFNVFPTEFDGAAAAAAVKQEIVPVFIKKIVEVPQLNWQSYKFGKYFGMVEIVGIIKEIDKETSSNKIIYLIEDYTGSIKVKYLLFNDTQQNAPKVEIDVYARVRGTICDEGNAKSVLAFQMVGISDPNVVNQHFLEAMKPYLMPEFFQRPRDRNDQTRRDYNNDEPDDYLIYEDTSSTDNNLRMWNYN